MVEGARLESVYTSKAYREFESLRLRKKNVIIPTVVGIFHFERLMSKESESLSKIISVIVRLNGPDIIFTR